MSYKILKIERDDASVRTVMERYKAFRLLALQTAPEMFGSTYERELAFTDDAWYDRLASPMATSLLAIQEDRTIGSITMVGPLPFAPEQASPTSNPWGALGKKSSDPQDYAHFRVNGMFTLPEVRGQGAAKALMQRSIKQAILDAKELGREYVGSIVVDSDNPAAVGLYKKFGYETIGEEPREPGSIRTALLMKYVPNAQAAALVQ
ncbi:acyl-CoA N-acyltransferase [Amylocarpus encephaloides]|uniref:Acyl-CoA N-acyltransferase n=1 Tax=Amylocarpus encephaloides TaxID=45428 RepID=A0A9P7YKR4_9HELO|nr:acyl-CoA N-acyltransferase [Amylocarpus encephaloides]